MLPPASETIPLDEVAAVRAEAASRVGGGPPARIGVSSQQLAAALEQAGFRVVREPDSRKLTL